MLKAPKITSSQYLRSIMLDYLDYCDLHSPRNHGSNLINMSISKTITNNYFNLQNVRRDQRYSNNILSLVYKKEIVY